MKQELDQLVELLKIAGVKTVTVQGVHWYEHSGFMIPAYLPHCEPFISSAAARSVLKIAGVPFVRWSSDFGILEDCDWWYVIREGPYSLAECKQKTRWQVRKGRRSLSARLLLTDEALESGYDVCRRAVKRYSDDVFLPKKEVFERRVRAAKRFPGVIEYCGVFNGDLLVALSENLVQNDAVFLQSIWYDPEFLPRYSSYVLTDFILDHYINQRGFAYVSDGARSLYHQTNVQNYYIEKFDFKKKYAVLNIEYTFSLALFLKVVRRSDRLIFWLGSRFRSMFLRKLCGLLLQDKISRACRSKITRRNPAIQPGN